VAPENNYLHKHCKLLNDTIIYLTGKKIHNNWRCKNTADFLFGKALDPPAKIFISANNI
jgi:hypothetical protein